MEFQFASKEILSRTHILKLAQHLLNTSKLPKHIISSNNILSRRKRFMVKEAAMKAEIYRGDKLCREKFGSLLFEFGLPNRLLSIQEIEECGYVKETGFVWLKHKKKKKKDSFRFDNVLVRFDDDVTAYIGLNKIKKLCGVKAKEFVVWISLDEIQVNHSSDLITFKTKVEFLSKSLPLSVFEDVKEKPENVNKNLVITKSLCTI